MTSALVLVGLALAVGGFAWMSSDAGGAGGQVQVLARPEGETKVGFTALTPREQRKKNNLEKAQRELHRIRQEGEEVAPGLFRIKDETGDPTYYVGDLIPGKGRDGEPMYLAAQLKRTPIPAFKQLDNKHSRKVKVTKRVDGVLKGGKKADEQPDGSNLDGSTGGGDGASGGSTGTGGAPK